MAQFTPPGKTAILVLRSSRPQGDRPPGIGLSVLSLLALLIGSVIEDLLELPRVMAPGFNHGATLGSVWLWIGLYFGVGVLCIWQLWRGRGWARLLVLLWSFASVARALSFLSEHNLDPAALMGHPLRFFQAVLAGILLYWLNTPRLRAWYRKSSAGAGEVIAERLQGRLCTGVEYHADDGSVPSTTTPGALGTIWRLYFEHDAGLILRCPWRIVLDDNLAFATAHDGDASPVNQAPRGAFAPLADQQPPETVPAPGHSPQEARRLLENLRVRAVRIVPHSSDLFISFEMGIELQTWSSAPATGSVPLWEYSEPGFTMVANVTGVKAQLAATPSDGEG